jgi:hypothetical protein
MIHGSISRMLFSACLLAGGCGTAAAWGTTTKVHSPGVFLVGKFSVKDLLKLPARAAMARDAVEAPGPVFQGGSTTSKSSAPLPLLPSNVQVVPAGSVKGFNGHPSSNSVIGVNGFVALHSKDSPFNVPDQGLAVNNNVAAEIVNGAVRFFDATTGAPLTPVIDFHDFFRSDLFLNDPQVFFDPTLGRWFFTLIESDSPLQNIKIAISTSSDPLGEYYIYDMRTFSDDLPHCGGLDCLPDFPHVGYDAHGLYISVNLSGNSGPAATYALPKFALAFGEKSATVVRLLYPDDITVQPSVPAPGEPFETAANGTEYLLEARFGNQIRVWAISNTNNIIIDPSSLRGFFVDVPSESFAYDAVDAVEPDPPGPYCQSHGAKSAPLLIAHITGARFTATIQKANGRLYGALPFTARDTTGFVVRDVVAWFALKPSVNGAGHPSASIFTQGYVVPPSGYSLLYPAFGFDKSGAGVLGFSITNKSKTVPGGFPSAAFIQFNGTGIDGNIIVSGQGIASFDGVACSGNPFPIARWGDYGAATVDAATGFFYTANENISGERRDGGNWGTFITQVQPSPLLASARR